MVRPEGAAQLALIGPANAGKSSLHTRLTGSRAQAAPYPFTTQYPEPGMMPYEDIQFQLVDLPAIAPEHPVPWLGSTLQTTQPDDDPFAVRLPTLLLANKAGGLGDADAELRVFLDVAGLRYPALAVSATTGQGLGQIDPWLFRHLGIARVYTKAPGRPPDLDRPFSLRHGQTVKDVAQLVHKDLARTLKYARVWRKSGSDGQQVGREHPVTDGDVVEIHV